MRISCVVIPTEHATELLCEKSGRSPRSHVRHTGQLLRAGFEACSFPIAFDAVTDTSEQRRQTDGESKNRACVVGENTCPGTAVCQRRFPDSAGVEMPGRCSE